MPPAGPVRGETLENRDPLVPAVAPPLDVDLTGETHLVTGGTSGIGRVAARVLADRGGKVLVVGSRRTKGEQAAAELREETSGEVTFLQADLAEADQVRGLAREVRDRVDKLDVLANNAGIIPSGYETTADGLERTAAVNVRAPYLLTVELAPLLARADGPRIVNTSSEAHRDGRADVAYLSDPGPGDFAWWRAYATSKLADLALTIEQATRLEGTGVAAHAYHPGFIPGTRLMETIPWYARAGARLASYLPWPPTRTTEAGGADLAAVCAAPRFEGQTGLYVNCGEVATPDERARDATFRTDLWTWCASATKTDPDDLVRRVREARGDGD